jgi:amino acid adenylation domain-containing protein
MVVGALAVLQAGAAYVALDPASPEERLVHALRDSGARVLLARAPGALCLAGKVGAVPVLLDETGPAPAEGSAALPPGAGAGLDGPAYVIYTSGSTGRPKGVEIGHRSLASLVAWHQRVYEITPADRTTLLAGPGFDASVWEMWPALTAGACLCLPAPEALSDSAGLWRWLAEHGITLSFLPTPLLEAVLREDLSGSSLRAVLTGGDRLHRLPRPDLPFPLFNHYGPTENTVVTTWDRVAAEEAEPPIGRPVDGVRVYLLDRSLQPVPLGVAGELCAAGAGLAQGYLGGPEPTAERFVPDPFAGLPGARMYRTGDLARRRADGRIEFLARLDHQVKIRGYRIELGEIESVLCEHPAVRESVVVVAGSGLAAYVVPADGDMDGAELRRFLRARLPEYMVPATLSPIAKLPLTANGKVDRAAFAGIGEASVRLPEGSAPRNGIEALLAELWCELLGREQVGVFDSFFELGGHSLQIARLVARVREVFGVELPVRSLFETSTIAELADVVARRLIEQDEDEIDAVLAEMGMAGRAGFEEELHG